MMARKISALAWVTLPYSWSWSCSARTSPVFLHSSMEANITSAPA
jgi:hypothetical protein